MPGEDAYQPVEPSWRNAARTLRRFVRPRVRSEEEAAEIVQESLTRYLEQAPQDRDGEPPPKLLRTIALNIIRDRWRRRQRHLRPVSLDERTPVSDPATSDPLERLWLNSLLARLPADYRKVIRLRIVEGYSRKETARQMGRSEASVRGLQYRAVKRLRDLMLQTGAEEEEH